MNGSATLLVGQRSRARIAPFRLHRPSSVADAVGLMASAPRGAVYMAGGIDLVERMKSGFGPGEVIHLGAIRELVRIDASERALKLGACTTHLALGQHEQVRTHAPALARCWSELGNPRVRAKGTLGGNVMAHDPAYDATLVLMAAGASVTFVAEQGRNRTVRVEDAAVEPGLLTGIEVPQPCELQVRIDRSLDPALILVLALREAHGCIESVRVAIGRAYARPCVFPLALQEPVTRAGLASHAQPLASGFAQVLPTPLDDWRASAAYRARMIDLLLRRLLAAEGATPC